MKDDIVLSYNRHDTEFTVITEAARATIGKKLDIEANDAIIGVELDDMGPDKDLRLLSTHLTVSATEIGNALRNTLANSELLAQIRKRTSQVIND
ncbi:hypothetical protein SPFM20_00237 [Salmonella phage SPFM20]|nr:hypothetical protein SPFM8_00237 [Salmonella phage SPFM8]VFR14915.1 hypothetical protein SPFM20_00237 [Salmonella phage SPFM20]